MTTQAQLEAIRATRDAARDRAALAFDQGDHNGAIIAGSDAMRLDATLRRAVAANVHERQATR
jgi:hypothetical protein